MNIGNRGTSAPSLAPQHMALIPPERLNEIQKEYWDGASAIAQDVHSIEIKDRRFSGSAWQNVWSKNVVAMYLLNSKYLRDLANSVDTDSKNKQRIVFATEQMIDALSPANFFATNPEALNQIIESQGDSLRKGIINLLGDMQKGKVSQTDETAFEVGKNLANTPGSVVFRNALFELIQYKPSTETVYERPFLMVPPCINKFYILDLQPENSVVRYMVEQGHTVYLVSWKNPDSNMNQITWDDYVETGVVKAIEVVREISAQDKINILGFCVGGTLVSTALAVLAARKKDWIASLTLLTTLLDFSDTGILDVFIDESLVNLRENSIGGKDQKYGLMSGLDLANTFSFLRPNELVWNYVVDNYLKGKSPVPFDLLYWNGDSTNLPGPMYCWYLRHTYLQNELVKPNQLQVCGVPIDLGKIKCPTYIYASREDHIVPWHSGYRSTQIVKGPIRFILGASGHIAGVINPPHKKKRNYWSNSNLPKNPEKWFEGATEVAGSWWPDYVEWLSQHGGQKINAPKVEGNSKYKVLVTAPGTYVKEKAQK